MDGTQKKISFGFSKLKQASQLVKPVVVEKKEVEFVDSFDGEKGKFSFQGAIRNTDEVKKPLVIPLIGTRSAYEVIKAKLECKEAQNGTAPNEEDGAAKDQEVAIDSAEKTHEAVKQADVKPSLEALAAKEIIEGLKEDGGKKGPGKGMVIVPDMEKPTFAGEKESTLEDYESIPVDDFGLALLRGMGWTPQSGIGKENKVVAPVTANVRPKRLGLGAEGASTFPGERLPIKKGSFVRVVAGQLKGTLGVVESFDGDTASVFVKLDDGGHLSLSENVIIAISKKDYETKRNGIADVKKEKPGGDKRYGIIEKVKTEKVIKEEPRSTPSLSRRPQESSSSSRTKYESKQGRSPDRHKSQRSKEDSSGREEKYRSSRRSKSASPKRNERTRKEVKSRRSSSSSEDSEPMKWKHRSKSRTRKEGKARRGLSSSEESEPKRSKHRRKSGDKSHKKKRKVSSESEEERPKKQKPSRRRSSSTERSNSKKKKVHRRNRDSGSSEDSRRHRRH